MKTGADRSARRNCAHIVPEPGIKRWLADNISLVLVIIAIRRGLKPFITPGVLLEWHASR